MEIKEWTYEDFPEFTGTVEGAGVIETTGEELGVRYAHDIEYIQMDGVPLHIQLLIPFSRNQFEPVWPCVVFIQGSAWFEQDVYMQLPALADLAKRGYIIACVQYRHSGMASFPAQVIDARNAVRFLRQNAGKYHIDPDRVIMSGDSSGGHTAMFAGIMHDDDSVGNLFPGVSAEVKGIINLYGSVSVMMEDGNPSTVNHHLPDSPEGQVMGGINLRERPDLCKKLSVECNITESTDIAPVLIFHGTKDRTVNTQQSVTLYRRLREAGKQASLYLVQGADHGGPEFWTDKTIDIMDMFIKQCFA
ncbi:alpha/beta hydrolase [Hungatella hathewayi]|uniref:alpha/beta hydrolase n=1 Tax=Hungatella hathewayi TaxID=154046 RepID=UPI00210D9987|nr:alpha/beta hydrolase [Hungatella hathewayi]MCQ5384700.1 alpha/beta hydrolase [Hungatella hathewayi]